MKIQIFTFDDTWYMSYAKTTAANRLKDGIHWDNERDSYHIQMINFHKLYNALLAQCLVDMLSIPSWQQYSEMEKEALINWILWCIKYTIDAHLKHFVNSWYYQTGKLSEKNCWTECPAMLACEPTEPGLGDIKLVSTASTLSIGLTHSWATTMIMPTNGMC